MGIGPGQKNMMTSEALETIQGANIVIGYKVYIDILQDLLGGKEVHSFSMRQEVKRCQLSIEKAQEGRKVALVSSGDGGIYGMAGLIYELVAQMDAEQRFTINVVPGITAANACASLLGAPLMVDWAVISLSDALLPWDIIEKRLKGVGEGDFVIVLYNPKSRKRPNNLKMAIEILKPYRNDDTLVGIVRNAYREGQEVTITTLAKLGNEEVDMFSTVFIGNSSTKNLAGYLVTERGYPL